MSMIRHRLSGHFRSSTSGPTSPLPVQVACHRMLERDVVDLRDKQMHVLWTFVFCCASTWLACSSETRGTKTRGNARGMTDFRVFLVLVGQTIILRFVHSKLNRVCCWNAGAARTHARTHVCVRGWYQNSFLPMSLVFVVRSRSSLSHWSAMVPADWEMKEVDQSVASPRTWPGKSFGISLVRVRWLVTVVAVCMLARWQLTHLCTAVDVESSSQPADVWSQSHVGGSSSSSQSSASQSHGPRSLGWTSPSVSTTRFVLQCQKRTQVRSSEIKSNWKLSWIHSKIKLLDKQFPTHVKNVQQNFRLPTQTRLFSNGFNNSWQFLFQHPRYENLRWTR